MNIGLQSRTLFSVVSLIAAGAIAAFGQLTVWSPVQSAPAVPARRAVERVTFPAEFKLFSLERAPLEQNLYSIVDKPGGSTIVSLPNAKGVVEHYEIFEASNFDPELQAKFPNIRAYSGRGLTDRFATVKLSISPRGLHGTVFRSAADSSDAEAGTEIIEPYSEDASVYAVFKSARKPGQIPWACKSPVELALFSDWKQQLGIGLAELDDSNAREIRTMRLAQSVNGEYSTSIEQIGANLPTRGCPVAGTMPSTGNWASVRLHLTLGCGRSITNMASLMQAGCGRFEAHRQYRPADADGSWSELCSVVPLRLSLSTDRGGRENGVDAELDSKLELRSIRQPPLFLAEHRRDIDQLNAGDQRAD
ncbi:MAG: hypothetical protein ACK4S4_04525 [Pyrinomonadaceae bacterium]